LRAFAVGGVVNDGVALVACRWCPAFPSVLLIVLRSLS
jgi:hypothetical protein